MARFSVGDVDLFAHRVQGRRVTAVAVWRGVGALGTTLHRSGGFSVIGIPRRGGTSVVWGEQLRARIDDHACDCRRVRLGPVSIHYGQDF